jgi:cell division protein FtsW
MRNTSELKPPLFPEPILLGAVALLVGFSLVMIYSTTGVLSQERYGDALFFVKRQGIATIVGLCALFAVARLELNFLKKISPYLCLVAVGLLALTLIPGLGSSAGGAKRWVVAGPIRFQPGEFVKVCMVVWLAGYLGRNEAALSGFVRGIAQPLAMIFVACALFLKQPDFGSSAILTLVALAMVMSAGVRLRYLLFSGLLVVVAAGLLIVSSPYRMSRMKTFLAPWEDASGKGYQLIQSLIAVGTGQVTGVGLGASQQKLFFLPAAHTDFIFAVIAEELGFVGCCALMLVFVVILWRGMSIAARLADDTFAFSLAVGLTMLIVVPALLNVGVVTGLLPTKGMVLPLVGFGGSSLIGSLVAMGLLLAVARDLRQRAL